MVPAGTVRLKCKKAVEKYWLLNTSYHAINETLCWVFPSTEKWSENGSQWNQVLQSILSSQYVNDDPCVPHHPIEILTVAWLCLQQIVKGFDYTGLFWSSGLDSLYHYSQYFWHLLSPVFSLTFVSLLLPVFGSSLCQRRFNQPSWWLILQGNFATILYLQYIAEQGSVFMVWCVYV